MPDRKHIVEAPAGDADKDFVVIGAGGSRFCGYSGRYWELSARSLYRATARENSADDSIDLPRVEKVCIHFDKPGKALDQVAP